ncbi:MAG: T9SS type A sorting domain-containing protein [Bacteroidia bacterium]
MKKLILLLFLVLLTKISFGQLGLIFQDSLLWQQSTYYTTGPSYPGQGFQYYYTYNNYYINGDTIVGIYTYKKLYFSSSSTSYSGYSPPAFNYSSLTFNSYILKDSNCVYQGTPGSMTKILDYNLQTGDSFKFAGYTPKIVLLSIDSALVNGSYYKRFNFDKGIKWIKGMGDAVYGASFGNYYFFNPSGYSWMYLGSELRCYSEHNNTTYGNYCNLPLGINQLRMANDELSIYPNPTSNQFIIEANTPDKLTVVLYDVNGRLMFSASVSGKSTIDVSSLNEGVYTLAIKTVDRIINKKLVILR